MEQEPGVRKGREQPVKKKIDILELLGVGIGCVGLSYSDFCALTPVEFDSVCGQWGKMEESRFKRMCENARLSAFFSVRTKVKEGVSFSPRDLGLFGWEQDEPKPKIPKADFNKIKNRFETTEK